MIALGSSPHIFLASTDRYRIGGEAAGTASNLAHSKPALSSLFPRSWLSIFCLLDHLSPPCLPWPLQPASLAAFSRARPVGAPAGCASQLPASRSECGRYICTLPSALLQLASAQSPLQARAPAPRALSQDSCDSLPCLQAKASKQVVKASVDFYGPVSAAARDGECKPARVLRSARGSRAGQCRCCRQMALTRAPSLHCRTAPSGWALSLMAQCPPT